MAATALIATTVTLTSLSCSEIFSFSALDGRAASDGLIVDGSITEGATLDRASHDAAPTDLDAARDSALIQDTTRESSADGPADGVAQDRPPTEIPVVSLEGGVDATPIADAGSQPKTFCRTSALACWLNPKPQGSQLLGAYGASKDQAWFVGRQGTILRYKVTLGANDWVLYEGVTSVDLQGVSGSASNNVVAVGDQGNIFRFDGQQWKMMARKGNGRHYDVWVGGTILLR